MRNDAINMEVNEGLLAFGAEEEGAVVVIVHKEVFGNSGTTCRRGAGWGWERDGRSGALCDIEFCGWILCNTLR